MDASAAELERQLVVLKGLVHHVTFPSKRGSCCSYMVRNHSNFKALVGLGPKGLTSTISLFFSQTAA